MPAMSNSPKVDLFESWTSFPWTTASSEQGVANFTSAVVEQPSTFRSTQGSEHASAISRVTKDGPSVHISRADAIPPVRPRSERHVLVPKPENPLAEGSSQSADDLSTGYSILKGHSGCSSDRARPACSYQPFPECVHSVAPGPPSQCSYSLGVAFKHRQGNLHGGPKRSISTYRPRTSIRAPPTNTWTPMKNSDERAMQAIIRFQSQIVWEIAESRSRSNLIVKMGGGQMRTHLRYRPEAVRRRLRRSAQRQLRNIKLARSDIYSRGLHCGLAHTAINADDLELFRNDDSWWSLSLMDAICLTAANRLGRLDCSAAIPLLDDGTPTLHSHERV